MTAKKFARFHEYPRPRLMPRRKYAGTSTPPIHAMNRRAVSRANIEAGEEVRSVVVFQRMSSVSWRGASISAAGDDDVIRSLLTGKPWRRRSLSKIIDIRSSYWRGAYSALP